MKFSAERESLLAALQSVIGVVERRQTMPILANLLLSAEQGKLSITATDLEVELVASAEIKSGADGRLTLPGRKLLDICRSLPDGVTLTVTQDGDRVTVKAGKSRFVLATLPATDFPVIDELAQQQVLKLAQADLRRLLDKTHFSMAQQDVRYYLNGMLLETDGKMLRTVATDGHRLALCEMDLPYERRPVSRSLFREKACSNCSVSWARKAMCRSRSDGTTFAPRSATFASHRSSLTADSRNMAA